MLITTNQSSQLHDCHVFSADKVDGKCKNRSLDMATLWRNYVWASSRMFSSNKHKLIALRAFRAIVALKFSRSMA
jgi:hypothetical protein